METINLKEGQATLTWHPINGRWVHIVQIVEHGRMVYYTDGQKETVPQGTGIDHV